MLWVAATRPEHLIPPPSTYSVTLTATNAAGWDAVTASSPITVSEMYKIYLPAVLRGQ